MASLDQCNLTIIGKLGGEVYYESRQYGHLQRLKRSYFIPVQPGTFHQTQRWLLFSAGAREWGHKSSAEKKVYEDQRKYLNLCMTGYNYFMSIVLKGGARMIQRILRGSQVVVHGNNNITIPAVDMSKSCLFYNAFLSAYDTPTLSAYGIEGAQITTSTNIFVKAWDTAPVGNLIFAWQIVEFA